MILYAVKLSDYIDKKDPKCRFKSYIRMMQFLKQTCMNAKCSRKADYGMWDTMCAVYRGGPGPFCSFKCFNWHDNHSRNGKFTKKKDKKAHESFERYMVHRKANPSGYTLPWDKPIAINMEALNDNSKR